MIYYLTRVMMKYLYYVKKDTEIYLKLSEFNNVYKEKRGKPLFFLRVRLVLLTPLLYVYAMYWHRKGKRNMHKRYWRYNRFFKIWWNEWWEKGYSNPEQYVVGRPKAVYKPTLKVK